EKDLLAGRSPCYFLGEGPTGRPSMLMGMASRNSVTLALGSLELALGSLELRSRTADDPAAPLPHAERLHQALERDQVVDIDHVTGREDQCGNDRRQK